ncbi:MAG: hypothetical protein KDC44_15825, partial [Phaeodactylibacter sp.]|nr:hypothetical protein [Phaeodactylibacter sp.]
MDKELLQLLLDKGLLAIILAVLGYWINKSLSKVSFEQSKNLMLEEQNTQLKNRLIEAATTKELDRIEQQLAEFYYPIYFRLQKDNALWKLSPQLKIGEQALPQSANAIIEQEYILKNHREIVEIIESKIHLIEIDEALQEQINLYLKHVAVYETSRLVEQLKDLNPIDLQAPWPAQFFPLVEGKI